MAKGILISGPVHLELSLSLFQAYRLCSGTWHFFRNSIPCIPSTIHRGVQAADTCALTANTYQPAPTPQSQREICVTVGISQLSITELYFRFGMLFAWQWTSCHRYTHLSCGLAASCVSFPCCCFIAQVSEARMNQSIYRQLRPEVDDTEERNTRHFLPGCAFLSSSLPQSVTLSVLK